MAETTIDNSCQLRWGQDYIKLSAESFFLLFLFLICGGEEGPFEGAGLAVGGFAGRLRLLRDCE